MPYVVCLASSVLLSGISAFRLLRKHDKKEVVARLCAPARYKAHAKTLQQFI